MADSWIRETPPAGIWAYDKRLANKKRKIVKYSRKSSFIGCKFIAFRVQTWFNILFPDDS
jgi:hypothetical protein